MYLLAVKPFQLVECDRGNSEVATVRTSRS